MQSITDTNEPAWAVPERFRPVFARLADLGRDDRYLAAYVFGSTVDGSANEQSDVDAVVVVEGVEACAVVMQPVIDSVKVDVSFNTLAQAVDRIEGQIRSASRPPFLARAIILFDNTGRLAELQERARAARPKELSEVDLSWIRLAVQQVNDKVFDNLERDPSTALLAMHTGLSELITSHYRVNRRFQVSSKKLFVDLRTWDAPLADLIAEFVAEPRLGAKTALWARIVDHVCAAFGGRSTLDAGCSCDACRADIARLTALTI